MVQALERGKHVFVEKPLCLSRDELRAIETAAEASQVILMVGFNRRHSPLIAAMRASPCLRLDLAEDERVALLLEDYDFFVKDTAFFCDRLGALTEARGKDVVSDWQTRASSGDVASVVRELLLLHYDPVYLQSMRRNFTQYETAQVLAPVDHTAAAMSVVARSLLAA